MSDSLSSGLPPHEPVTPSQKNLLGALAVLYIILLVFWVANNMNKPLFGLGAVEGFYRMPQPIAANAPMTWKFAPGLGAMAISHRINPPAVSSAITRLEQVGTGTNGAILYRASYLSDSVVVFGILGLPASAGVTPAPGVVVCHPSDSPYQTGLHTLDTVKFIAERGIVAFAPDFRGWGPSVGPRGHEVRDVWNALASLRADKSVKRDKVGLIGFSMGGGIAATAAAADTNLALLVLYYPQMRGSVGELYSAIKFGQYEPGSGGIRELVREGKAAGADNAELEYVLKMISPIYHLDDFAGRVAIFHGKKDNVVSIRQSEALEQELRHLGKKVDFWQYDLSHAFANSIENLSKQQFETVLKETLF